MTSDNTVVGQGRRDHVTRAMTSSCDVRCDAVQTTPSQRLHGCRVPSVGIDDTLSLSVRPYVFGAGVVIRNSRSSSTNCHQTDSDSDCGRVTVDVLDTADTDLSRLAVVLLNNSLFLATYYSVAERRQVHHYIKPSSSLEHLSRVITHINTTTGSSSSSVKYTASGVMLTVSQLSRHDVVVSVTNDVAVLHVRHVTRRHVDLTTEQRRLDADSMTSR